MDDTSNDTDIESLNKNIVKLSAMVERVNSYTFIFLRGIIGGVGTFIGATIIATIVITILIQILGVFGISQYFESFLPKK
jgi:hypothetical protein